MSQTRLHVAKFGVNAGPKKKKTKQKWKKKLCRIKTKYHKVCTRWCKNCLCSTLLYI